MDSKISVEVCGIASAQLIRPDVAQAKWLAFPLAAMAWGIAGNEQDAVVLVDQLADFDAWRVGGGVAFRW